MSRTRNRQLTYAAKAGRVKVWPAHRVQPLPWGDDGGAHWSEVSWWYDEIPGHEPYTWSEWQDAFAEVTLKVVAIVWHRTGARLYAAQRDALLREDLQSWLSLQAQTVASGFMPDRDHPVPESNWAAYLTANLERAARWHFKEAVGRRAEDQAAHNAGIASTDLLDQLESEDGVRVDRHPLHGEDLLSMDPLHLLIRLDHFSHVLAGVEAQARRDGTYTTTSSNNGICAEISCGRKATKRGLCPSHYNRQRELWGDRSGRTCLEEGCTKLASMAGRCGSHYQINRTKQIAAGTWEPRKKREGPCIADGCEKPMRTRGMCPMHYQRWRKNRGTPEKNGGGGVE